jgi:hypothetical protein
MKDRRSGLFSHQNLMHQDNVSYLCEGFYPLEAKDLMEAAWLFALWKARRTYGPNAQCSRLHLQSDWGPDGATFKALIESPLGSETCLLTVVIEDDSYSQVSAR